MAANEKRVAYLVREGRYKQACAICEHYRPHFQFRFCEWNFCKYDPDRNVYRHRPLEHDTIYYAARRGKKRE